MKVSDLMTPVGDYQTLGMDATLGDAAATLKQGKHRDILIVNTKGQFAGLLTMTDIILALEPNYKKLLKKDLDSDILSNRMVADQFKEYDLWGDTLGNLCAKAAGTRACEAMHVPDKDHYLTMESDLEHALHLYMVGTPQPLIVRSNGTVVGVLRMSDVFGEVINRMHNCVCTD